MKWENQDGECECVWPMCQWTKHDAHNGDTPALCLNALCRCEYTQWLYFEHDNHNKIHRDRWLYYEVTALKQKNTN